MDVDRINIRPGVSVLAVLRHLNYKPWFALAEFVDNSVESFLRNKNALTSLEEPEPRLRVSIDFDGASPCRLTIRDNASGIKASDYERAFRPAELPPNRTGLSEFGMGMKSAACWFAPQWLVRTSAIGENVERTVRFDIERIVEDHIEELDVSHEKARVEEHYTEVVLLNLYTPLRSKTIGKIKDHLAHIYRHFTRSGLLDLQFNREPLFYEEPRVLVAPYFRDKEGGDILWKKEIDFDFGRGLKVFGFAALRARGSTSSAGFALFRRNRLIQGSADEGYRPQLIFGDPNSYAYQRLFGELHLDGFDVSHTKDGFRWEEGEDAFLEILKSHLDGPPLPLLDQAENFRVRPRVEDVRGGAEIAVSNTAEVVARDVPSVLASLEEAEVMGEEPDSLPRIPFASWREVEIRHHNECWKVTISLTEDPAVGEWLEISSRSLEPSKSGGATRELEIRMSLLHPFMERFGGVSAAQIEPLLRVAMAFALGEVIAYDSSVSNARAVRDNANELLRKALANY